MSRPRFPLPLLIAAPLCLLAVCICGCAHSEKPQPQPSDAQASALTVAIRNHYGSLLGSVEAQLTWLPQQSDSSDGQDVALPAGPVGEWVYEGTYRLKGLPLQFPFTVDARTGGASIRAIDGAYTHRVLIHDDIGGVKRFYLLAAQYHRDFPRQATFSYWCTSDNGVSQEEPYVTLLKGHPGVSVVVYKYDDYWGNGQAPIMGLYWWDKARDRWLLLHRGPLPDLR